MPLSSTRTRGDSQTDPLQTLKCDRKSRKKAADRFLTFLPSGLSRVCLAKNTTHMNSFPVQNESKLQLFTPFARVGAWNGVRVCRPASFIPAETRQLSNRFCFSTPFNDPQQTMNCTNRPSQHTEICRPSDNTSPKPIGKNKSFRVRFVQNRTMFANQLAKLEKRINSKWMRRLRVHRLLKSIPRNRLYAEDFCRCFNRKLPPTRVSFVIAECGHIQDYGVGNESGLFSLRTRFDETNKFGCGPEV